MIEKITALYARFSRDDKQDNAESVSIANQRQLLQEYADRNGYTNCRFYVDDGYTGTNFDRPDFKRMLEDVENGLVGTIIVKDMSRFGRNYILVGQYVELVLPQYDIRVIGISDNYDSYNSENDMFAFSSIFNEMFAADISKKVRIAKKNLGMNGIEVKSHPIYGYRRRNGKYYDWEIDEEAAKVIRLIFDLFLNQNMSINKIATFLRKNKILKPSAYLGYKLIKAHTQYSWAFSEVKRMLQVQEYCGDTINFKTEQVSYKLKDRINIPKENWVVFKNQHPAIISRDMFEQVQEKLKTISKNSYSGNNEMKNDTYFRGKCYCDMCNQRMCRVTGGKNYGISFNCRTHRTYGECKSNRIMESYLRNITLDYLKAIYNEIKHNKESILSILGSKEIDLNTQKLESIEKEVETIKEKQRDLYESYYKADISIELFKKESEQYETEKETILKMRDDLKRQNNIIANKIAEAKLIIKKIESYQESDFNELTEEMCNDLVEKIIVGPSAGLHKKNYGKRKTDVYIYNLGNIGDFVDVSYKKYSDRIKAIIPKLLLEKKCSFKAVEEALGCKKTTIYNALEEEQTSYKEILLEYRKSVIIDSIKKHIPINTISNLIGYYDESCVYWFVKEYMNTTYPELCRNIDNY